VRGVNTRSIVFQTFKQSSTCPPYVSNYCLFKTFYKGIKYNYVPHLEYSHIYIYVYSTGRTKGMFGPCVGHREVSVCATGDTHLQLARGELLDELVLPGPETI
jgi:hypothetical protein